MSMAMDNEGLQKLMEMHIKECDSRDARNTRAFEKIEGMFKGIWDRVDETREDLQARGEAAKKDLQEKVDAVKGEVSDLQMKAAVALGALIVLSKLLDFLPFLAGHK